MQEIREIGVILLIIVLIIAGVQWFFLRFTHWPVVLIATGFISLFISFIYVSMKNASPNGGSNSSNVSEFIIPTLVVFTALLFGLWLVCYFTQNHLPKMVFILPMCIIFVFAIGGFIYQYIDNVTQRAELFSHCDIELQDKTSGLSIVNEIGFQNTTSSLVSNIATKSDEVPYPRLTRNTSKIIFQCYSTKTNRGFRQDFPFDYSLCNEKKGPTIGLCFWVRKKVVSPMKIILQPGNKVDLYLGGNLVKQYQLKD